MPPRVHSGRCQDELQTLQFNFEVAQRSALNDVQLQLSLETKG